MIKTANKNILECDELYLIHQCNCISISAKGLAKTIFELYPEANTYINPQFKREVGTISCHKISTTDKTIINIYAQRYPGISKYNDTTNQRIIWFKSCLNLISEIPNIQSIAVPYKIGCGLAGGNWEKYLDILNNFVKDNKIDIIIYKL